MEKFVLFKVPFDLENVHNIEAIEFISNNKKIIHHVNYGFYSVPDTAISINSSPSFINTDINPQGEIVYKPIEKNIIYYTGWIPGASKEEYHGDIGWLLPKRGVAIFTVHYAAIATDEESSIGVNLYFKKDTIKRPIRIISLGSGGIGENEITPNFIIWPNKISTYSLSVLTPEDQSIMYVWPHMHYLGKEFTAYAVTPQNDTIHLVHIPKWDFRWQELYKLKFLTHVPAGSVVHMIGSYDNTANNPFNPNTPPRLVYSSGNMSANDEMFTLLMLYVPYKKDDEKISYLPHYDLY